MNSFAVFISKLCFLFVNCTFAPKKALDYNLIGGKYIRIIMTVDVYKNLISIEQQTSENLRLANLLGWCHELVST